MGSNNNTIKNNSKRYSINNYHNDINTTSTSQYVDILIDAFEGCTPAMQVELLHHMIKRTYRDHKIDKRYLFLYEMYYDLIDQDRIIARKVFENAYQNIKNSTYFHVDNPDGEKFPKSYFEAYDHFKQEDKAA